MSEFFEDLFRRKTKKAETELQALGWHKKIFNKQFFNEVLNLEETLGNMNADKDSIEHLTLKAA